MHNQVLAFLVLDIFTSFCGQNWLFLACRQIVECPKKSGLVAPVGLLGTHLWEEKS